MAHLHAHRGVLDAATVADVRRVADAAEQHDGIEALGEQTLLNLADPGAAVVHVTARTADGDLTGYAQAALPEAAQGAASAELVVDPPARRRGVGSALLAAVGEQTRSAGAEGPHVWAHGNLPGARALAARAGMTVVRELWQMALDLPGSAPDTPAVPDGAVVRPFELGRDEGAWLEVNARAFADHPEQGRMTLADLRARQGEPWFAAEDVLLVERDGRLLASAWIKVEPGSDEGELYALGVDPAAQGQGLGRLLTALVLHRLATRGLSRAVLYTEATNAGAVRTYTAAGFTVSRTDVQYS